MLFKELKLEFLITDLPSKFTLFTEKIMCKLDLNRISSPKKYIKIYLLLKE